MAANLPLHADNATASNIAIRVDMALDRALGEVGFAHRELDETVRNREAAFAAYRWAMRVLDGVPPPLVPAPEHGDDEPSEWPQGTGLTKAMP